MKMKWALSVLYLLAIVAGNLAVVHWGPPATLWVAFLSIGLTLSLRDAIHDLWGARAVPYSLGLIVAGGGLSYLLNSSAHDIALASIVAFLASEGADLLVYQAAARWAFLGRPLGRLGRSNASNVVGAIVDSIIFPTLAFGAFSLGLSTAQMGAKVAGGLIFSLALWLLDYWRQPKTQMA